MATEINPWKLELDLTTSDHRFAEETLESMRAPVIAFGVGAGAKKRIWPASRYAELAQTLNRIYGASILVVGSQRDSDAAAEVTASLPAGWVLDMTGRATLRQTGSLLARCRLYVGSDSGPMHLAAAAETPVVEISCHPKNGDPEHENSPVRFGPWGVESRVLQPETATVPCSTHCREGRPHCILSVGVEEVISAVGQLL